MKYLDKQDVIDCLDAKLKFLSETMNKNTGDPDAWEWFQNRRSAVSQIKNDLLKLDEYDLADFQPRA